MFSKILIANRGEIACRVIATARRLGIRTVAVFSDADARARHVTLADEAVRLGPAPASESYLRADRIIEACRMTGAEAIHPGYGFLSENPDFVTAVEATGLVFIGPSAEAIRAMGLKDAAKSLMEQAGVPVVPGYHGGNQDAKVLAAEAEKIGYPVLIKARAGGGGKGMRHVVEPAEFQSALESAQREAAASFGDPACLIEKYIPQPRHIEIQIFGDEHGNIVHLFERDCSLQRRHQKVIEEAPAPGMPEPVRAAMGKAAVEAARSIGYSGAGTVEFIVDGTGPLRADGFWFMEMNTRLQVEHPVSEAITGLDFVELQLRVAAGEPLPIQQDDLKIDGWSFEARIYAEDAGNGFLPATGTLEDLTFPDGAEFERAPLRIDSGVRAGDTISPFYDPMVAKVIAHAATREQALSRLAAALAETQATGVVTNLEFLEALTRHASVQRGDVETDLIARDLDQLVAALPPTAEVLALAAIAGLGLETLTFGASPRDKLSGWRHWGMAAHSITLIHEDTPFDTRVTIKGNGQFIADTSRGTVALQIISSDGPWFRVSVEDRQFKAMLRTTPSLVTVTFGGHRYTLRRPDPLAEPSAETSGVDVVYSPMPGLVREIVTQPGAPVSQGEALLVLEAMKMEHILRAPRDGVVAEILAAEQDQVADGALLLRLEPADG